MEKRYSYCFAVEEYRKLKTYLEGKGYMCEPSGSLRRKREDVGDIDFLVEGDEDGVLEAVAGYPEVQYRIDKFEFMLRSGIPIHAIPEGREEYNFTLWQSTGPKKHVKWIKKLYRDMGSVIERRETDEERIYRGAGLGYIPPEERHRYQGE